MFTKVEALERFTDLATYGRNFHTLPQHNFYVPVANNVVAKPKFRELVLDDELGEEYAKTYTYKSKDVHSPMPAVVGLDTMKPMKMYPKLELENKPIIHYRRYKKWLQQPGAKHNPHPTEHLTKQVWTKNRRLSKSNKTQDRTVNYPTIWRFSTLVNPN